MRDKTPGFTGIVSDLGGPTANMFHLKCKDEKIESACRRLSCVYPDICENMGTDHSKLISLYRKARALKGVKKVLIGSGLRYDLAVRSPEYIKELVTHHVGGYLKIAPEHTEERPLSKMMKPGIGSYDRFKQLFDRFSREAGKEQYLIPYFIAAHPGTEDEDMLNLALWLKKNNFRLDQVQTFIPTPMAMATTMYHSERNPLRKVNRASEIVGTVRNGRQRKLHKAFLRYHDPANWPLLREALKEMGRADLIGNGKKHLIPAWQPAGTVGKCGSGAVASSGLRKPTPPKRGEPQRPGRPALAAAVTCRPANQRCVNDAMLRSTAALRKKPPAVMILGLFELLRARMMDHSTTTYEKIGGDAAVALLCDRFYEFMASVPQFSELRSMHPEDLKGSRDKLYMFLSGWFGGPDLFRRKVWSPPSARSSHAFCHRRQGTRSVGCLHGAGHGIGWY